MSKHIAKQIHLISRPSGMPSHEHFKLVELELPAPQQGEALVQNRYMSVDPYMRGRMRENAVYAEAYALDSVMYGGAIGEVIESADPSLIPLSGHAGNVRPHRLRGSVQVWRTQAR